MADIERFRQAVERALDFVESGIRYERFTKYKWESETALNVDGINALAKASGIGPVFDVEHSDECKTLKINSAAGGRPIVFRVYHDGWQRDECPPNKLDRAIEYLEGWLKQDTADAGSGDGGGDRPLLEDLSADLAEAHRLATESLATANAIHGFITRLAADYDELPENLAGDLAGRANRLFRLTNVESAGAAYARVKRPLLAHAFPDRCPHGEALTFVAHVIGEFSTAMDRKLLRVKGSFQEGTIFSGESVRGVWHELRARMGKLRPPDDDILLQMQIQVAKAEEAHRKAGSSGQPPQPEAIGESGGQDQGTLDTASKSTLLVDVERLTVTWKTRKWDLGSELAARWLKVLTDNEGKWIPASDLDDYDQRLDGVRTDRLKKHIPECILKFIETSTRHGSRLVLPRK